MNRSGAFVLALGAALVVSAACGTASTPASASASKATGSTPAAQNAVVTIFANLRGALETTGGDRNGSGSAQISLNVAKQKACWSLRVANIGKPLSAHVHQAPRGEDGMVVIPLGAKYSSRGCVTAPKKSIRAVANNPGAFYVNVHTQTFLNGAVRGQLHK